MAWIAVLLARLSGVIMAAAVRCDRTAVERYVRSGLNALRKP